MRTAPVNRIPTHKALAKFNFVGMNFVSRASNQEANPKDKSSELNGEQLEIPIYLRKPKKDY